jgi:AraC-like DNA-binding protein
MKLHLLDRSSTQNSSFNVTHNKYSNFLKIWHYHPELELVLIEKSSGTRFIGDNIEKFEAGEVVLIGENLPHMWLNEEAYFNESSNLTAEAIAIHFKKDFLGEVFLDAPEMKLISELIQRAKRGVKFSELKSKEVEEIRSLMHLNGFEKAIGFLMILNKLAKQTKFKLLASEGFISSFNKNENKNLEKIYQYVFQNFNTQISLNNVAEVACMNSSSFSRYFKRIHRKTFTEYVNELRIGFACKMLIEGKYSITDIGYESGFNNVSNFNRQFKKITNLSPSQYLKKHL